MPKLSAGLLLYRRTGRDLEVLLVHPGSPYWAKKDAGAWSIPKGLCHEGEDPLTAARREFADETGCDVNGTFIPLARVKQAGGKIVAAWAVEGDCDASAVESNTFMMEWPPKSGTMRAFPEVDRAQWFAIREAKEKILNGQAGLLEQLESLLADAS